MTRQQVTGETSLQCQETIAMGSSVTGLVTVTVKIDEMERKRRLAAVYRLLLEMARHSTTRSISH